MPDAGEDFGLVILAVVVLIAVILAGGYLIYVGSTILAEAAFEAVLASALIPGARRGEAAGWMRPAVRGTAVPFASILVLAVAFGSVAAGRCPEARRVVEVMACAGL